MAHPYFAEVRKAEEEAKVALGGAVGAGETAKLETPAEESK